MNKTYWIEWIKKAGVRALKTVAETALSVVATAKVMDDVNWKYALSASVLAGIISLLINLKGIPEVSTNTEENE